MKISNINNSKYSFRAATVSINAISDTHGNLSDAGKALTELSKRQKDVFYPNKKGNCNVLTVCGDWFMDGAKKGYKSNPDKPLAGFQLDIFNAFVNEIKKIAANTVTLFTPGNHEFDGGVPLLDDVLTDINADVVMTNLDIQNSTAFNKSVSSGKLVNEKILEVDDDKNSNLKHKILFLGISPVNMLNYQRNLDGIVMNDIIDKPQYFITKEDYYKTLENCKSRIKKFKSENPNGIVILLSHTGVKFADNLIKEAPVDLVFDGHEHKEKDRKVNNTPVIPLSQNFKKIANAQIHINDDGSIENIVVSSFSPLENPLEGSMYNLFEKLFSKDLEEKYYIKTYGDEAENLNIENVRSGNNYLANFITDGVLSEIKKIAPEVNFFALNSSSIRHGLSSSNKGNSYLDILNVLSGIREDESRIMLTKITGKMLTYMVLDNYIFNSKSPDQNTIIHYSGLITDRTKMLNSYKNGAKIEDLSKYIIDSSTGKPIDLDKEYVIANPEKYFDKNLNKQIKALKSKSKFLGKNVHDLFKQYIETSKNLFAKCDERIR